MPVNRLANVLLTKPIDLKRNSQPHRFSYFDLKDIVLQNVSYAGQHKHSYTRTYIHKCKIQEKRNSGNFFKTRHSKALTPPRRLLSEPDVA